LFLLGEIAAKIAPHTNSANIMFHQRAERQKHGDVATTITANAARIPYSAAQTKRERQQEETG
jgi:hypothetical protein